MLRLTFADGTTGEVAALERMRGPVFGEARTPEGFARMAVDAETGTAVWPGGADLAPDTLYERIRTGAWPQRGRRWLTCSADQADVLKMPLFQQDLNRPRPSSIVRREALCSSGSGPSADERLAHHLPCSAT